MTYGNVYPPQPPTPPKRNRGLVIALVFLSIAVSLLCCAGVMSGVFGDDKPSSKALIVPEATVSGADSASPTSAAPKAAAAPQRPTAANVKLTVKTTSKECFGSAGCNVQWSIEATLARGVRVDDPCDVTYEVRGLTDVQIHTLRLLGGESYEQDGYQFGQTSSSSKKLTAKVTEVECG